MRVIGISPLDKDSTVSFVEDGRVIFACGEERLSRVKLQDGFPALAMQLGFEKTGWNPASVDAVAYGFFDPDGEAALIRSALQVDDEKFRPSDARPAQAAVRQAFANYAFKPQAPIPGFEQPEQEFMPRKAWFKRAVYQLSLDSPWLDWSFHRLGLRQWRNTALSEHRQRAVQLMEGLRQFELADKLKRFAHHNTHAANAFYSSGYERSLIVTFDGYGSGQAGGVYIGDEKGIRNLVRFPFPNSLGQFYEHVTSGLGFKPSRHEGKIVGLAAYGDAKVLADALLARFDTSNGQVVFKGAANAIFARALAQKFSKRDIAAAYQSVLETVAVRTIQWWASQTGMRYVTLSGGVHANVKLNQRVREIAGIEGVFVYPNMGDGGCATGAAWLVDPPATRPGALADVYWGPEFSDAEIIAALEAQNLKYQRHESVEVEIGRRLAANQIVARFNGRMEYGPRALGNRSVLYAASDPEVNQWLNKQLGRTEFMPFAPSALAEESHRLFVGLEGVKKAAEFMTLTFDCTDEMKRLCPAAVHIDGTARPQLVTPQSNPSYHRILSEYHRLTGVPAIINTSFNMHEEPIVCSPADAVRAFLLGNIHVLAIGQYIVTHPDMTVGS